MRKLPSVAWVTRYYCPDAHTSFGLLPDFYCSRMPGTLDELEEAVARIEQMPTVEQAANELRPADADDAVTLESAIRWVSLRVEIVRTMLTTVIGLLPAMFAGCKATVASFRERLKTRSALVALRGICERHLYELPPPLGLMPPLEWPPGVRRRLQQSSGPDPPS